MSASVLASSIALSDSPPLGVWLQPYDSRWPSYYRHEALRIKGSHVGPVVRIEHIGSTAIPGMSSKPVIDILVGFLYGKTTLSEVVAGLLEMGYRTYEPISKAEWSMLWRRTGDLPVHLHVVQWSSGAWKTYIAFRDVLRAHPDVARRYKSRKEAVVRRYAQNAAQYSGAKRSFVSGVLARYAFMRWPSDRVKGAVT